LNTRLKNADTSLSKVFPGFDSAISSIELNLPEFLFAGAKIIEFENLRQGTGHPIFLIDSTLSDLDE
jgi:hypothetical protein